MFLKLRHRVSFLRSFYGKKVLLGFTMCFLLVTTIFQSLVNDQNPSFVTRKQNWSAAAEWESFKSERRTTPPKLILYWSTCSLKEDFGVGFGNTPFQNCSVESCFTTTNRSLLNVSDAVLFHTLDMYLTDPPPYRLPHQLWISYHSEPPRYTPPLEKYSNFFNLTMTYRFDSDIYHPYGRVLSFPVRNQSEAYASKTTITRWTSNLHEFRQMKESAISEESSNIRFDYDAFVKAKKKSVAWFVSNCRSGSNRGEYVQELAQYIDVDIYGRCGNFTCVERNSCFATVGRDYKFYLAFENSICVDYVTEKFFNALNHGIIPVVFGLEAHRRIAPPNSFIDADAFESPKALAEYLHTLMRNDTLYKEYLTWNDNFKPTKGNGWCNLCQLLNDFDASYSRTAYKDMNDWWITKANCKIRDPAEPNRIKLMNLMYPVAGFGFKLRNYLKSG